jgi:hypothetical protein
MRIRNDPSERRTHRLITLAARKAPDFWKENHMHANQILIARRFLVAAFIAAGGAVLTADAASAARHPPQGYAGGYRSHEFSSPRNVFESYASGRQPYENPDRELYVWGN